MTNDRSFSSRQGLRGLFFFAFVACTACCAGPTLQVKPERSAILKTQPSGDAPEIERLPAGTRVSSIGDTDRYYQVRLADGRTGWSYKGNFLVLAETEPSVGTGTTTPEALLDRRDLLKIIVLDVEVGDSTLIICPEEDGRRDVILIDTGEDDSDRIKDELARNGFSLTGRPITRFVITHYDSDHCGDAEEMVNLAQVIYDHGDNIKTNLKDKYLRIVSQPGVDRRKMTLDYVESFSGGVTVECVAVNQATDFDRTIQPSPPEEDNPNSIALIISWSGFDYFTGGDLTKTPEHSLSQCVKNCDVYHVDHHGSSATSSNLDFVKKLDPEVSIASNGTRHGHPTKIVARRLIDEIGSVFLQTNANQDARAHQPDAQFVADDSFHEDDEMEDQEGALGTIKVIVDPNGAHYHVLMPGLTAGEVIHAIE